MGRPRKTSSNITSGSIVSPAVSAGTTPGSILSVSNTNIQSNIDLPDAIDTATQLIESAIQEAENVPSIILSADTTTAEDKQIPNINSPEWHDYAMTHFVDSELIDGRPSAAGLRRVFGLLIGDVSDLYVQVLQCPTVENEGRATVVTKILYYARDNTLRTIEDVADVFHGNTADPYCRYPTATASTMAEARCYRKALRLRVISSEEAQGPAPEVTEVRDMIEANRVVMASDAQKNTILTVAKANGIVNIPALFAEAKVEKNNINMLTAEEAQTICRLLNKYQKAGAKGGAVAPDSLYVESK